MQIQSFQEYLRAAYPSKTSATFYSYLKAIQIMDEIFSIDNSFELGNKSITEIKNPHLIALIREYIINEEDKFRKGQKSFFDLVNPNQRSYPNGRFCTAAIKKLKEYVDLICHQEVSHLMTEYGNDGLELSKKLSKRFHVNENGTEKEVRAKRRVGQDIFRAILLDIYDSKCCLTGLEIPEVLRASHIIPWSECKDETRLDPANGLCLSATYDAAFDRHLISFDEDYRLILSPMLKEEYSSAAFKTHFLNFEGKKITLPSMFTPSQQFLSKHREQLVV